MNRAGFSNWLLSERKMKPRLVSDMVSRAKRVEEAFKVIDPSFSYENEYRKDKGVFLKQQVSRFGKSIDKRVNLPIGSNQMNVIADAVKKYLMFMDYDQKKELETTSLKAD